MSSAVEQATLITTQAAIKPGQAVTQLALFNADGTPYTGPEALQAALQADSVATTIADLVIDFNALLAKLKAAGLMASV